MRQHNRRFSDYHKFREITRKRFVIVGEQSDSIPVGSHNSTGDQLAHIESVRDASVVSLARCHTVHASDPTEVRWWLLLSSPVGYCSYVGFTESGRLFRV